jgi:hypothetical protein
MKSQAIEKKFQIPSKAPKIFGMSIQVAAKYDLVMRDLIRLCGFLEKGRATYT